MRKQFLFANAVAEKGRIFNLSSMNYAESNGKIIKKAAQICAATNQDAVAGRHLLGVSPALAAVAVSVGRVNAVTRSCLSPGEGDHASPLRLKTEIKY